MPRPTSMRKTFASRRRAAARKAGGAKLDALLVTHPPDVGYLSGFSGDSSWLVLGGRWARLITDGRFGEQAEKECPDLEVDVRKGSLPAPVAAAIKGRGVRRLGFQKRRVSVAVREQLAGEISERRLRPAGGQISALRVVKDPHELKIIRRAVRIAEQAFAELIAAGVKGLVGRSEREIAAELDYRMRLAGADRPAFETIVASGPNGSNCHYRPADRRLGRGEALLVDWGASAGGYCSDLTRVVFMGTIPPELAEVYEVVARAQAAGIAACRPGTACKTPDAEARKVIESAGYGKQFVHGLGHGVGREVHEAPGLARGQKARLRAGMVVTVEPGIYLPGTGGVRLEDDVLVTSGGPRQLSSVPKGLLRAVLR